jgi:hypothetical protein
VLYNIKYCNRIDYLEWVAKSMSERRELNATLGEVAQASLAKAKLSEKLSEQKATVARAR